MARHEVINHTDYGDGMPTIVDRSKQPLETERYHDINFIVIGDKRSCRYATDAKFVVIGGTPFHKVYVGKGALMTTMLALWQSIGIRGQHKYIKNIGEIDWDQNATKHNTINCI